MIIKPLHANCNYTLPVLNMTTVASIGSGIHRPPGPNLSEIFKISLVLVWFEIFSWDRSVLVHWSLNRMFSIWFVFALTNFFQRKLYAQITPRKNQPFWKRKQSEFSAQIFPGRPWRKITMSHSLWPAIFDFKKTHWNEQSTIQRSTKSILSWE